jgi:hypothetical protein
MNSSLKFPWLSGQGAGRAWRSVVDGDRWVGRHQHGG